MVDGRRPAEARDAQKARGDSGRATIEKSAVEARQGFRGRRIFYILAASLALALAAYALVSATVSR